MTPRKAFFYLSNTLQPKTLQSFLKYLVIGAIVGVAAIGGREVIAMLLPADTPEYYALSVAIVYAFGIVASYIGHRKVSFSHVNMENEDTAASMSSFTAIAIFGLVCTTGFSVCIRFLFPIENLMGSFSDAASFAIATLITSVITFSLNARHTFREKLENQ
jgi:putative flippase GtrA|tara:strand:- start:3151 stop:3633 length:483 start_codon:yes stop_codon:yes gene_type:complete